MAGVKKPAAKKAAPKTPTTPRKPAAKKAPAATTAAKPAAKKAPAATTAKPAAAKKAPAAPAKNSGAGAFPVPPFNVKIATTPAKNDDSEKPMVKEKEWWEKAGDWFNDLGEKIKTWTKPEPENVRRAREAEEECRRVSKQIESEIWWRDQWRKFERAAADVENAYKRQAEMTRNKGEKEMFLGWSKLFGGLRETFDKERQETNRKISDLNRGPRSECDARIKSIISSKTSKAIHDGTAGAGAGVRSYNGTLYRQRATDYQRRKPMAAKLVDTYETGRSAVKSTQYSAYSKSDLAALIGKPPEDPTK